MRSHRVASSVVAVGLVLGLVAAVAPSAGTIVPTGPLPLHVVTAEPVERFPSYNAAGEITFDMAEGARELQEAASRRASVGASESVGTPADRRKALRQVEQMLRQQERARGALGQAATQQTSGVGSRWRSIGPHDLGGRTHAVAIDPRRPSTMYAGAIAGGIWKSEDAGQSWRPLADTAANVAISALALDPQNPDVIYAGTGDALEQGARTGSRGAGILISRDAGANWSFLTSTQNQDFLFVNALRVSRQDPQKVFAATSTGFFISGDGGQTWTKTHSTNDPLGCTDFDVSLGTGPETLLLSCGGYLGSEGVFHSGDAGRTWTQTIGKVNQVPVGRTAVAFAPSDRSVAYASVSDVDRGVAVALLRSGQGGAPGSWEIVAEPFKNGAPPWFGWCVMPQESKDSGQGYYDNVLAVDPTNPDRLFIGGVDIFRSDDGGRTMFPVSYWWLDQEIGWDNIAGTQYNHADQHFFMFHPDYNGTTNQSFFTGNDGGIFRTDNATAPATNPNCQTTGNRVTWTPLNSGYSTSLFREGVVNQNGHLAGGLQDNGSWVDPEVTEGRNVWSNVAGGDGGWTALSPDGSTVYATFPNGHVSKIVNGVEQPATRGLDLGQGLFVTPLVMDETDPEVLWIGMRRMFRTTNGAQSWEPVSPPFNDGIQTIAVSPVNGAVVLASTRGGTLYRTTSGKDALPTWEQVGTGLPQERISAIAFDPTNDQTVYLTIGSFRDVGTVFRSTDGGVTWSNIDGAGSASIPDTAAYAVAVDPTNSRRVYVGTDTGIFESVDGGGSWSVASQALARTTVEDLSFRPGTSQLFAFTYGRGVYAADVGG